MNAWSNGTWPRPPSPRRLTARPRRHRRSRRRPARRWRAVEPACSLPGLGIAAKPSAVASSRQTPAAAPAMPSWLLRCGSPCPERPYERTAATAVAARSERTRPALIQPRLPAFTAAGARRAVPCGPCPAGTIARRRPAPKRARHDWRPYGDENVTTRRRNVMSRRADTCAPFHVPRPEVDAQEHCRCRSPRVRQRQRRSGDAPADADRGGGTRHDPASTAVRLPEFQLLNQTLR